MLLSVALQTSKMKHEPGGSHVYLHYLVIQIRAVPIEHRNVAVKARLDAQYCTVATWAMTRLVSMCANARGTTAFNLLSFCGQFVDEIYRTEYVDLSDTIEAIYIYRSREATCR
jgi:hypothetical protein